MSHFTLLAWLRPRRQAGPKPLASGDATPAVARNSAACCHAGVDDVDRTVVSSARHLLGLGLELNDEKKVLRSSFARDALLRRRPLENYYDYVPEKLQPLNPDLLLLDLDGDDKDLSKKWKRSGTKTKKKMANSTGIYDSDFDDEDEDVDIHSTYNAADADTDTESLLDVDSPADGYFEPRSHPQETFVQQNQNPTAAEQAAKAIEAAQERTPSAPEVPAGRAPSASRWAAGGQTPLLDAGPPPPDYAAATAGRRRDLPPTRDGPVGGNGSERDGGGSFGTVPSLPHPAASPQQQQQQQQYPHAHAHPHPHPHPHPQQQPHDSTQSQEQGQGQEELHWPLGNRGNPFANPNWLWGPQGNPFANGGFNTDHPLFRQAQFGPQGFFGGGDGHGSSPTMQSMRDNAAPPNHLPGAAEPGLRGGGGENEGVEQEEVDEETGLLSGNMEGARGARSGSRDRNKRGRRSSSNRERERERGRKHWWKKMARRCCKPMCLVNLALVLGILILVVLLSQASGPSYGGGGGGGGSSNGDNSKDPVTNPPGSGHDTGDGAPIPAHPRTSQCPFTVFSAPLHVDFASPASFSFLEMIDARDNTAFSNGRIGGTLSVAPAPAKQDVDVRVWISVAMTAGWSVEGLVTVKDDGEVESVEVLFPKLEKVRGGSGRPCMDIAVAILVREGVEVGNWDMSTGNLDVVIEPGLFSDQQDNDDDDGKASEEQRDGLRINNSTSIFATHSTIKTAYWSSRETRIETLSGSIRGSYALRDLLSLKSQSGSIHVDVDPKAIDKDAPRPAQFDMFGRSGSLRAYFPLHRSDLPERDYRTRVETRSSSIRGRFLLGSTAVFSSESGSKEVEVLPYLRSRVDLDADADGATLSSETATLRTEGRSGSTKVTVLAPYVSSSSSSSSWPDDGGKNKSLLDHLSSTHHSNSGSISLTYPDEWTGTIDGETSSGSIKVLGRDVKIIADVHADGRHVVARKGWGSSKLGFKSGSGSVRVLVGQE